MNIKYLILALDHRQSLKKLINQQYPNSASAEDIIFWKKLALESLSPLVNHILLDPDYGLKAYRTIKNISSKLILSIEESGYFLKNGGRLTKLKYSVEDLQNLGADLVKLLVYYNPNADTTIDQNNLICETAKICQENKVPLLLEVVPYQWKKSKLNFEEITLASAKAIVGLNCKIDIYKTPYPGDDGCRLLTKILNCPWVLLSGGEDFNHYFTHLETALNNGASGFAAGRTLWKDFIKYPRESWPDFFNQQARQRLTAIVKLTNK